MSPNPMPTKVRITRPRRGRRGVALLLVLGVVATASVLGWAMLSAASLRIQVDANVSDSVQSQYIADSGISYAMYYLRYPEKSPVALTAGTYNNHYGGQYGLTLWADAAGPVDIVVTNTAKNTFVIRSTATIKGVTQASEAEVVLTTTGYTVNSAAAFGGEIQIPAQVSISGLVRSAGAITNALGNVLTSLGGSSIVVSASAVPAFSELSLVGSTGVTASTGGSDRTYTVNGVTYIAERAPTTITGTLNTSRPALNPANVWYSDNAVTLNGATINGTLILRDKDKDLTIQGTNIINAKDASLPALIVGKEVKVNHTSIKAARLNVQGVTYFNNKINSSGSTLLAKGLTFQGALLMGDTSPKIEGDTGPINITYDPSAAQVKLVEGAEITGISVNRWSRS